MPYFALHISLASATVLRETRTMLVCSSYGTVSLARTVSNRGLVAARARVGRRVAAMCVVLSAAGLLMRSLYEVVGRLCLGQPLIICGHARDAYHLYRTGKGAQRLLWPGEAAQHVPSVLAQLAPFQCHGKLLWAERSLCVCVCVCVCVWSRTLGCPPCLPLSPLPTPDADRCVHNV